jgi:hypothetical protein
LKDPFQIIVANESHKNFQKKLYLKKHTRFFIFWPIVQIFRVLRNKSMVFDSMFT